jgi:lysozyme
MTLPGVDVSAYQGAPGAWRAEAGKIAWAGVKISELAPDGTRFVNSDDMADFEFLKREGKGRVAYLYGHPASDAAETVDFFASTLKGIGGLDDGDAVALDFETADGRNPAQCCVWAKLVLRQLTARFERKAVCYTFEAFAEAGNCAGLGSWPLWIAAPSDPSGSPQIPAPWKTFAMQQTRITGPIDRDVANFETLADMARALGKAGAEPAPPPPPLPPAPPRSQIHRWSTWGLWSLNREAQEHHTTPGEMLSCAAAMGHHYERAMAAYIKAGDFNAKVPRGTFLYAPKRHQ